MPRRPDPAFSEPPSQHHLPIQTHALQEDTLRHLLSTRTASCARRVGHRADRPQSRDRQAAPRAREPLADLQGAGSNLAATIHLQAGDVRRFRNASAFARFCGHRLYRGGKLSAALYRIAIVQQRDDPDAKAYLARKASERKTPREVRRAPKRHLASVLYLRLHAWAEHAPAMSLLT